MRHCRIGVPLILLAAALTTGCETFTPPTKRFVVEKDKAVLIDTVATRRGTYLFKKEASNGDPARWVLVAEPPPDAALASAVKAAIEASAKIPSGAESKGKGSIDVTQTLTKLVERTQAITILRDSLFRLSEAYANGTIDRTMYSTKYDAVLTAVQDIIEAEEQARRNEAESLKNEAARLELQREVLETEKKALEDPQLDEKGRLQIYNNIRSLGGDGADPR